jgi:hypothetical protein
MGAGAENFEGLHAAEIRRWHDPETGYNGLRASPSRSVGATASVASPQPR